MAQGRKEPHVVIEFKEKSVQGVEEVKPLILNATNRKALKKLMEQIRQKRWRGSRYSYILTRK